MDEEIVATLHPKQKGNYIPEDTLSSKITGLIQDSDPVVQVFTAMEIYNRLAQKGLNMSKVSTISQLLNGMISVEGVDNDGGKKYFLIHANILLDEDDSLKRHQAIEEVSYDEVAAKYQESVSSFEEDIVKLEVLSDAINDALKKNDDEWWEVIDKHDLISSGPFIGKTLIEAVLIYKSKILLSADSLRRLGNIDDQEYPGVGELREKLYDANEEYLLLSLGVGEQREELTHVIPKTESECLSLIGSVISRRNPRELLDWMKDIHRQIDANNAQDGTVEKNYKFFSDNLSMLALEHIRADVYENEQSEEYKKPDILLEFAVLVSGRAAWDKESYLLMSDIGANASPVDKRLWKPELAEQALIYAMDIQDDSNKSMLSKLMQHAIISEPLLAGKSPHTAVQSSLEKIKNCILSPIAGDEEASLGEWEDFDQALDALGYADIVSRSASGELATTYNELNLEDMVAVSGLLRISQGISKKQTHTRRITSNKPYLAKDGESVETHKRSYAGPGPAYEIIITTSSSRIPYEDFPKIATSAVKESTQHVGAELDKNFDDSFWQQFGQVFLNQGTKSDPKRAQSFGIQDINSIEYKVFTLYNDINGNGGFKQVSDTTSEGLKTAGFMAAMIAGSVLVGGGAVTLINMGRAAKLGMTTMELAHGGLGVGLAMEGALMGAAGSGLGYGLDGVSGDMRGFYTPSEAILGVSSDFALGALTGALGGPLVQKYGNSEASFIARKSLKNKAIFAGDLAFLGLLPEHLRIQAVDNIWHGSEIFVPESQQSALDSHITGTRKDMLSPSLSGKRAEIYISSITKGETLPEDLQEFRFFLQEFPNMGFTVEDISPQLDTRFLKAYATWKVLSPGNGNNIWRIEPEFAGVMNIGDRGLKGVRKRLLEATNEWIIRQEKRLTEIGL